MDILSLIELITKLIIFYSKPLTYALCLEYLGANVVHEFVGQEPSGRIFNELVLDNNSKFDYHR